jgi:cytochrome P450
MLLAVLEVARRHAPVNNINVVLQEPKSFSISGRNVEFPAGTVVAASMGLAGLDPNRFESPDTFNPHRPNLTADTLNFNSVGFPAPDEVGRRTCPGRNVAVRMCGNLLVGWREANPTMVAEKAPERA